MANKVYEQTGDYIPRQDAMFLAWADGFARGVSIDPAQFGLTAGDVDEITSWAEQFQTVYEAAQTPRGRTPSVVQDKKQTRRKAERILRGYAQRIKRHPGVSSRQLIELGIHLDDPTKTPIGPPKSRPLLKVRLTSIGGHVLRYADETTPNAIRRPPGAAMIQIYRHIGNTITSDPGQARELGLYGRQPIRIDWPPDVAGLTVTYFGRWVTKKGLKGPWSLPAYMMVACGGCVLEFDDEGSPATRRTQRAAA